MLPQWMAWVGYVEVAGHEYGVVMLLFVMRDFDCLLWEGLDQDACAHHVVVEGRPAVFGHEDRFDEDAHFVAVSAEGHAGLIPFVVIQLRQDDGHVDVAPLVGSALGVGPVHHNLGPAAETWRDYAFVFSDEPEGFIARKHFWSIHCCICLVCSTK